MNIKIFYIFKLLTMTDIAIIGIILLSALISLLHTYSQKKEVNDLKISLNNEIYATFSLNENGLFSVDSLAVVEIIENRARMVFSTCKNQHCVIQGWSDKQPIICVPNKIIIEFLGKENHDKDRLFITQ